MTVEIEYDPEDPPEELIALYRTYELWADRTETDLQRAIRNTDELVVLRG